MLQILATQQKLVAFHPISVQEGFFLAGFDVLTLLLLEFFFVAIPPFKHALEIYPRDEFVVAFWEFCYNFFSRALMRLFPAWHVTIRARVAGIS
jgi:hypothetical protein